MFRIGFEILTNLNHHLHFQKSRRMTHLMTKVSWDETPKGFQESKICNPNFDKIRRVKKERLDLQEKHSQ
jgi:hypothetical protein